MAYSSIVDEECRRDNPAYYGYVNSEVWREKRMQRLRVCQVNCV